MVSFIPPAHPLQHTTLLQPVQGDRSHLARLANHRNQETNIASTTRHLQRLRLQAKRTMQKTKGSLLPERVSRDRWKIPKEDPPNHIRLTPVVRLIQCKAQAPPRMLGQEQHLR